MRFTIAALASLMMASPAWTAPASAPAPENVVLAPGDHPLRGMLFRPEGPGPFPAVVGLHGCGGLSSRSGPVATRYRDWAERLVKAGFVVIYPDSYGSRGLSSQCTTSTRSIRTDRERVSDAIAARHWLQDKPWIATDRISLMGWSNGGITTLWAIRRRAKTNDKTPDFRSAIALYPGCRRLRDTAWSARIPALILIGRADDWTPAAACEQMAAGARGRSAAISLIVYPRAYHDFDHPNRPLQIRSGHAFSADGSGKVHTGTNPAARADALKRVPKWLAR